MNHPQTNPATFSGTPNTEVELETHPHYTDHRFRHPRTVFCAEPENLKENESGPFIKGCTYDYSDRIEEWDRDKARKAREAATEKGHLRNSAKWYEFYLSYIYGEEVKLIHIVAGINHSNGWPYCVFGTKSNPNTNQP